jgi:hypothetical protein
MSGKRARLPVLFLVVLIPLPAAPVVEKVEPPNWWAGHTWNPIQILLTGRDLNGAAVVPQSRAFRVEVRESSDDGRYLFVYVNVGTEARPGRHRFQLRNSPGQTNFELTLDPPIDRRGRFQGFGPDDVIYLLITDRFANGDPSNDSPPEFRRPVDRSSPNAYHGGDFRGVQDHLGYFKDLGVTGIWLLPIYKNSSRYASPAHGYHPVDFYAVEPRFGTMQEFQELVESTHRIGIKLMQDQVANHCGPHHPWPWCSGRCGRCCTSADRMPRSAGGS